MAETDIQRVSTASDGTQGNSDSFVPSLSADGSRVAFQGYAFNLVPGDTNSAGDIFVKDLAGGGVVRASTAADGTQANAISYFPKLSADGTKVAFYSMASNLVAGDTNATADVFVKDLSTGAVVRASTAADGSQANGASSYLSLAGGGGHVAFMSEASNLVAGDANGTADVFVKNLATGAVVLASASTAGTAANAAAYAPSVSADGRHVAFHSTASNLVGDDTNGSWDVFVKDLAAGTLVRASTNAAGEQANGYSYDATLSADGRKIAFVSHASNLVAGDTNGVPDIFVKDLSTGAVVRVSTGADGIQANGESRFGVISADGSRVAFHSYASNLAAGDANGVSDVFVKDLGSGAVTRVAPDPSSDGLALSADGGRVGFHSNVGDLVPGDTNGRWDVFVATLAGGTAPPPADNKPPTVEAGRVLVVPEDSGATPLGIARPSDPDGDPLAVTVGSVPGTSRGTVYLAGGTTAVAAGQTLTLDQLVGLVFRPAADASGDAGQFRYTVSDGKGGTAVASIDLEITAVPDAPVAVADFYGVTRNGTLEVPVASGVLANDRDADGDTLSATLTLAPANGSLTLNANGSFTYRPVDGFTGVDSFAYVASDGQLSAAATLATITVNAVPEAAIQRVSTASDGTQGNSDSFVPSLSADGSRVAFQGYAFNLVPGDTNSAGDIFVKDLAGGGVVRASTAADGTQANAISYFPKLSADGTKVAFYSMASNLVAGDTNATADVFVKDLSTGAVVRASTAADGSQANGASSYLSLAGGGGHVAFMSEASNLVAGDANGTADVFVKNLATGAVVLASASTAGTAANAAAYAPSVSADGRHVAFHSTASNLVGDDTNGSWDVFVKDLAAGTLVRASTNAAGEQANGYSYDATLSADGRKIAFVSHASNLVAGDTNGVPDIFVKDLSTGAVVRVSTGADGIQANGESRFGVISADGSRVAFHSYASNLAAGDANGVSDVFVKDLGSGAVTRVAPDPSSDGLALSADGGRVGFHSNVGDLVPGDTNGRWDVFVATLAGGTAPPPADNKPPTVAVAIPDQEGTAGRSFLYQIPQQTFADGDNDSLTLSARLSNGSALPTWMSFVGDTFSGTVPTSARGTSLDIRVTAMDPDQATVSDDFRVTLLSGDEVITGTIRNDTLLGLDGNDTLNGISGNDRIEGGTGNDLLIGGSGRDMLVGGDGADTFDFNAVSESVTGSNRDVVMDFGAAAGDMIDLRSIDANTTVSGNQDFNFIGGAAFPRTAGSLRFSNELLQADVNGDGRADMEISVLGVGALATGNFHL